MCLPSGLNKKPHTFFFSVYKSSYCFCTIFKINIKFIRYTDGYAKLINELFSTFSSIASINKEATQFKRLCAL